MLIAGSPKTGLETLLPCHGMPPGLGRWPEFQVLFPIRRSGTVLSRNGNGRDSQTRVYGCVCFPFSDLTQTCPHFYNVHLNHQFSGCGCELCLLSPSEQLLKELHSFLSALFCQHLKQLRPERWKEILGSQWDSLLCWKERVNRFYPELCTFSCLASRLLYTGPHLWG